MNKEGDGLGNLPESSGRFCLCPTPANQRGCSSLTVQPHPWWTPHGVRSTLSCLSSLVAKHTAKADLYQRAPLPTILTSFHQYVPSHHRGNGGLKHSGHN